MAVKVVIHDAQLNEANDIIYVPAQVPHTPPLLHVRLCASLAHVTGALTVDA